MKNSNLTLKWRIALILPVPLLCLLGVGGSLMLDKARMALECASLTELTGLSVKIANAVHELQRERGRTAQFLGSKGAKFGSELQTQRSATDAKAEVLAESASHFDRSKLPELGQEMLQRGLAGLRDLRQVRDTVSAQSGTTADVIQQYTRIINAFLEVVDEGMRTSTDAQVLAEAATFTSILHAKEMMGRERAYLANAFASNVMAPAMFANFMSGSAAQQIYLQQFRSQATQEHLALLSSQLSNPVVAEVESMRQKAMQPVSPDGFGINPAAWFEAMTSKIDLMREVEQRVAGDLIAHSKKLESATMLSFALFAGVVLIGFIASATLSFFAIRSIVKALNALTLELSHGAEQIASASSQVASASQSLAQGASEQAASLQETSASTQELSSMTRKNAASSTSASELMAAVDRHVETSNRTLEQMVHSMHEINSSSDKISKIIKVIDEIAFQTNILALNAAVEAARAGEAGMGFAVVAGEVRNLAQRSAQAAKDTEALIAESIARSREGNGKLQEVTKTIQDITASASSVKLLVDEVNLGSQEQARGLDQISKAVSQMDQVTQSTAASAEQNASAGEELAAQAQSQTQAVAQLRVLVRGGSATSEDSLSISSPVRR